MTITTILLIILSVLFAGLLSYYQYFYKAKSKTKLVMFLALLRFLSVLGLLILLINPTIKKVYLVTQKKPLPILIDNSSSINDLKASQTVLDVYSKLKQNKELLNKFEMETYAFSSDIEKQDSFGFNGTQTNIDKVAKHLKHTYKNQSYPSIIVSDGNQTQGSDYVFTFPDSNKIFPVVIGDTTTVLDLKINTINVNKYAFLKNKFPVEVFVNYNGSKTITANFTISTNNLVVFKKSIFFSKNKNSEIIEVLLPADKVGLQVFKATISSSEKEKNTYNNNKNFAVEVIDQKSEIAIISSINHPDLGALKRAIETNNQRKVTILKPIEVKDINNYNVLILYQPTHEFKPVFDANKLAKINLFIITGKNTNFEFLNANQEIFNFKMSSRPEDYLSSYNNQFNIFAIDNFGFEKFPPLQNLYGTITPITKVEILLNAKVGNLVLDSPLLSYSETLNKRDAFLFGEDIWKWRLQSNIDNQSFEKFDIFIDKTIQFLASKDKKKNLVVNHENFYNSGDNIEINAQFFNKNYEFDQNANLSIKVTNKSTKVSKTFDMLKSNNYYKANFNGIETGNYMFTVKENNSNTSYLGSFEVLDFDIEKQFVNPDYKKLSQLANQTNGFISMPNQIDKLIKYLIDNEDYKPIQKEIVNKKPLIDWVFLLILIVLTLTLEWFIRKYNGLL